MMRPSIKVTVGRRFDNREQGLPDDSPLAWELHRKRGDVVHHELEADPEWKVVDWDDTDDRTRTHEDITVILELAQPTGTVALGQSLSRHGGYRSRGGEETNQEVCVPTTKQGRVARLCRVASC